MICVTLKKGQKKKSNINIETNGKDGNQRRIIKKKQWLLFKSNKKLRCKLLISPFEKKIAIIHFQKNYINET